MLSTNVLEHIILSGGEAGEQLENNIQIKLMELSLGFNQGKSKAIDNFFRSNFDCLKMV